MTADAGPAVDELQRHEVVERIWRRDHTVWKPDPTEIADRLGWLDIAGQMQEQVPGLEAFAREVQESGFRHVVLLGMGGSSLGAEVLRQTFGSAPGYPELVVLDSVVPGSVLRVTDAVDPSATLFLVSSKSGGTLEPNVLYKHFRALVEGATGGDHAGHSFAAVTDAGSSLETLAHDQGFRAVFLNPAEIGGRYSVLSYFGLVPAALMGVDLAALLDRADRMTQSCAASVPARDNPGARLGAVMGDMARSGRDKLTMVTSPSIDSFGLWAEQLIAESTGKEGKGIVPVAGEPDPAPATRSGDDRLFVYLRLEGDENASADAEVASLESLGQPVVRLDLADRYDLGGEFFRWEFGTAVAASLLEINPFDQPDVQAAKEQTDSVLGEYRDSGRLPTAEPHPSLEGLLAKAGQGDYLAIMAFLQQTPEVDEAVQDVRRGITREKGLATTLGYGPRFLHSTGQLHKGGPDSGLFLQLTADHTEDVPIPGEPYTFGVLADAQALGDLRALQARGQRAVRVHLGQDVAQEITRTLVSKR